MEQLAGAALESYGGLLHRRTAALYPFARYDLAERRISGKRGCLGRLRVEDETTAGDGQVRN
ncbi:MAG: hypothetical protein ABI988_20915 [Nitrospirota bacterium]